MVGKKLRRPNQLYGDGRWNDQHECHHIDYSNTVIENGQIIQTRRLPMKFKRASGIILHPTSLPGPDGIGSMGPEAYRWIDFLADAAVVLASPPPGSNRLWRFTLPMFLSFCWKSLFDQSCSTIGRWFADSERSCTTPRIS